ncbi:hypothetical protein Metbo_0482 [Methanobacterium lacus]|uniref:Uncharacterized protein n=1 Tax=Methanobacterium lacus (strain AL-21) TaxID=877455 RepID=F0T9I6_METLA|nr:DUF2226 domain-containing protein [Methanobacterium lacus]ADZ08734.1 hypothetical protein Metbo_0482 [Methanobacterium lacus]
MWFPSDEPKEILRGNNLDKLSIPSLGYLRILNENYEFILFLNDNLIVGAWCLDIKSLSELFQNEAMEVIKILPDSRIELFEINPRLFKTILDLNEECKLSLPIRIDMFWDKIGFNTNVSRETLLAKYRIKEPSEEHIKNLVSTYKS